MNQDQNHQKGTDDDDNNPLRPRSPNTMKVDAVEWFRSLENDGDRKQLLATIITEKRWAILAEYRNSRSTITIPYDIEYRIGGLARWSLGPQADYKAFGRAMLLIAALEHRFYKRTKYDFFCEDAFEKIAEAMGLLHLIKELLISQQSRIFSGFTEARSIQEAYIGPTPLALRAPAKSQTQVQW